MSEPPLGPTSVTLSGDAGSPRSPLGQASAAAPATDHSEKTGHDVIPTASGGRPHRAATAGLISSAFKSTTQMDVRSVTTIGWNISNTLNMLMAALGLTDVFDAGPLSASVQTRGSSFIGVVGLLMSCQPSA